MMENHDQALINLLKDLYKSECKKSARYLLINYLLAALLLITVIIAAFLGYELSTYDTVTITETTVTREYENSVEGDNANIINGNQYNDNATHNE